MSKLKFNIAVIAGYGRDVDKLPMHRAFVEESTNFALYNDTDLIFVVGGATNPDYPGETEAEASFRVIKEVFGKQYQIFSFTKQTPTERLEAVKTEKQIREDLLKKLAKSELKNLEQVLEGVPRLIVPVVILGTGNTSADTLRAVKNFLEKKNVSVEKLIYCSEISRSLGFALDGFFEGLTQKAETRFIHFACPFPETKEEFEVQKKKLPIKLLSHYSGFFRFLRYIFQKRHQRKVARIKREQNKPLRH